jgi:hypothetical protein
MFTTNNNDWVVAEGVVTGPWRDSLIFALQQGATSPFWVVSPAPCFDLSGEIAWTPEIRSRVVDFLGHISVNETP